MMFRGFRQTFEAVGAHRRELLGAQERLLELLPRAADGLLGFPHALQLQLGAQPGVLGHLRRALEFNLERTGRNGLPCGLAADWNDCIRLGYRGESVFVAFQVRFGLGVYAEIADRLGQSAEAAWARAQREKLDASIQRICWDGEWFIWAVGEDGTVFGTRSP